MPPPSPLRLFAACLVVVLLSPRVATAWNGFELEGMGLREARQAIIHTADANRLAARLLVPAGSGAGQRFPAIIMIDQWAARPGEFLVQAVRFASEGYIVLVYQPRGYGHSEGKAGLAGTTDLQDFNAVMDWLILHAPVDESRIGVLGASTGGVIALIAAAQDPLVKAVAALAVWTDFAAGVHAHGVGRAGWRDFLQQGAVPQRLAEAPEARIRRLLAGERDAKLSRWAEERSPGAWLELLNRRMVPVLLTAGYADELADVNSVLRFHEALQGPRRLLLMQGPHAATESTESVRLDGYVWNQALQWMQRWLQAADPLQPVAAMSMELSDARVRDEFAEWPVAQITDGRFYLSPRGAAGSGGLELRPWNGPQPLANALRSAAGRESAAGDVDGDAERGGDSVAWLPSLDSRRTLIFESAALARELPIRGIPVLSLPLKPSMPSVQLVASLYDVNNLGLGRLISQAAVHLTDLAPNGETAAELEFGALAHDIEAGNHLALVLDTADPKYLMPEVPGFAVHVLFSAAHQPVLRVPYNELLQKDPARLAQLLPAQRPSRQ